MRCSFLAGKKSYSRGASLFALSALIVTSPSTPAAAGDAVTADAINAPATPTVAAAPARNALRRSSAGLSSPVPATTAYAATVALIAPKYQRMLGGSKRGGRARAGGSGSAGGAVGAGSAGLSTVAGEATVKR